MSARTRANRLAKQNAIQILAASPPFKFNKRDAYKGPDELIIPAVVNHDVIYRVTTEVHRDGKRKREILRGRYMKEINTFQIWQDRQRFKINGETHSGREAA